jgi:ABC-type branched-subunit amino acid transport system ATPase component
MRDKKIRLKNVVKRFGGRKVVDIQDLAFGTHGIEGLIGPNGAGKTTLISLITRKIGMDSGQVLFYPDGAEIDISRKSFDEIARLGLVRTNQIIQDFQSLSIRDSLLLSLATPKYESFLAISGEKELRESTEEEIDSYLDYFHFENPDWHALSAGEKKLLDIIRCLLLKPKFLLMDEPTTGLPQDQTDKVIALMKKKTTEEDMSILIVEHDLDLIWGVSENVYFMAEGEILIQGPPEEIRKNRTVINKYMGGNDARG